MWAVLGVLIVDTGTAITGGTFLEWMNNASLYAVEIQLCGIPGQLCDLLIWTLIIPSSSRYIVSVATYSILDASRGISSIEWNRGVFTVLEICGDVMILVSCQ